MNNEEGILYYHGKTSDGYRFTIAGRYQNMLAHTDSIDVIMIGASLCSNNDNFAKKTGRDKAKGRLKSNGTIGKSYYSLYQETKPLGWFEEKRIEIFIVAAKLNEALTRKGFIHKFNLKKVS